MGFCEALLDLLFPPSCIACGSHHLPPDHIRLCHECLGAVEFVEEPLCTCCGLPFPDRQGPAHLCGSCLTFSFHFDRARTVLHYKPPTTGIISAFKYKGLTTGLATFSALFRQNPHVDDLSDPDLILPVPLHPKRLRERGFNQALLLARTFYPSALAKIDFRVLVRQSNTPSQTGLKGRDRRRNLNKAFRVAQETRVVGKKVLLVDDVFTTGTTVDECARTLKRAGAARVEVLTLARVV